MSQYFALDGQSIPFGEGQTILQAAQQAGVFIPHLCYHPEFKQIDWSQVQWLRSNGTAAGEPFTPDFTKSLAENGLGHKDVIRFRTPGMTGIAGSFA